MAAPYLWRTLHWASCALLSVLRLHRGTKGRNSRLAPHHSGEGGEVMGFAERYAAALAEFERESVRAFKEAQATFAKYLFDAKEPRDE